MRVDGVADRIGTDWYLRCSSTMSVYGVHDADGEVGG